MSGTSGNIGGSGGSSQSDVEYAILCDDNGAGLVKQFLRRYTSTGGVITHTDTQLDGTTAYTIVGNVRDCQGSVTVTNECFTVIFDGADYTTGDRIMRLTVWDLTQVPPAQISQSYQNLNTGAALAAAPNLNWLSPCDVELITQDICYTGITNNAPHFGIGDKILVTRVSDYTTITASTVADIVYYNVTQGNSWNANTFTPLPVQDMVPCQDFADTVSVELLCDSTNTQFLRFLIRNSAGSVSIADKALDGTTAYTPVGAVKTCVATPPDAIAVELLCDDNGSFLRYLIRDAAGVVTVQDRELDGTTTYTVVGTVKNCQGTDLEAVDFCLRANTAGTGYAIGDQIKLTRWFNPATNIQVSEVAFNMTAGGASVTVPLTAANFDECPAGGGAVETLVCATGVTLIRRIDNITGAITFVGTNGAAVAAPAAYTIGACTTDTEFEVFCDTAGSFLRRYTRNLDGTISKVDTTLDGVTVYAPVGTIRVCSGSDTEALVLCDVVATGVITQFIRHITYSSDGTTATIRNTALDGTTAYAPAGTVKACGNDLEPKVLCDVSATGVVTQFLRQYMRDSAGVLTVKDTALDGTTAYVVAGTIKICDPQTTTVESRMFDVVASTTKTFASLIPAGRVMISASVSIIAGTATITDANGTAITLLPTGFSTNFAAEVNGTLTPPINVITQAASRAIISYTLR